MAAKKRTNKKEDENPKKNESNLDPTRVSYAENYLRQNRSHYQIKNLKSALLAGGYTEAEIKQAEKNLKNPPKIENQKISKSNFDIGPLFSNSWNFFTKNWAVLYFI